MPRTDLRLDVPGSHARVRAPITSMIARVAAVGALAARSCSSCSCCSAADSTYTLTRELPGRRRAGHRRRRADRSGPGRLGQVDRPDARTARREVSSGLDSSVGAAAAGHGRADLRELAVGHREQVRRARARASSSRRTIPDGGVITRTHTYSLGQPRPAVRHARRRRRASGFAASSAARRRASRARRPQANQTLLYLAPALPSTSNVTQRARRVTSRRSTVCSSRARRRCRRSAREASELTQLVANTNATTAARSPARARRWSRRCRCCRPTLNHSTRTFAGLRSTLDALDPLVAASKPASRRLAAVRNALRRADDRASIPTVGQLNDLIRNPGRHRRSDHAAAARRRRWPGSRDDGVPAADPGR